MTFSTQCSLVSSNDDKIYSPNLIGAAFQNVYNRTQKYKVQIRSLVLIKGRVALFILAL